MPNAGVSKLAKAKRLNAHLKNTFNTNWWLKQVLRNSTKWKLQSTRTQVINFLAITTLQKAKPQTIMSAVKWLATKDSQGTCVSAWVREKSVSPFQKRVFWSFPSGSQKYALPPPLVFGWNPGSPCKKRERTLWWISKTAWHISKINQFPWPHLKFPDFPWFPWLSKNHAIKETPKG